MGMRLRRSSEITLFNRKNALKFPKESNLDELIEDLCKKFSASLTGSYCLQKFYDIDLGRDLHDLDFLIIPNSPYYLESYDIQLKTLDAFRFKDWEVGSSKLHDKDEYSWHVGGVDPDKIFGELPNNIFELIDFEVGTNDYYVPCQFLFCPFLDKSLYKYKEGIRYCVFNHILEAKIKQSVHSKKIENRKKQTFDIFRLGILP